ncbi:alkaline phytoceramidase [Thozetella sp. PMI_491]|nr:alkaline phytoceramidase [Thozetella sp. PMI_491]
MAHKHRHFSGDPYANDGYWSPPTSAANFCEEDYAISFYIAEFINTLSNMAYVYYALRPPRRGQRPQRVDSMSIALFSIGVTSAGFHATLRQGPQFMDDLSMLVLAAFLLQYVYTHGQSPSAAGLVSAVIFVGTSIMSVVYVQSGNILLHFYTFAFMLTLIWPRTIYLIYSGSRPKQDTTRLMRRFGKAVLVLVVAFVIWNIDLEKCLQLRALRNRLGLPWAFLLELHGWWHILTALGAAEYAQLLREIRSR